jgi:hypothetical protein
LSEPNNSIYSNENPDKNAGLKIYGEYKKFQNRKPEPELIVPGNDYCSIL